MIHRIIAWLKKFVRNPLGKVSQNTTASTSAKKVRPKQSPSKKKVARKKKSK